MMRGAILLLILAAAAVATFEQRTDIMGGDVEPAALAGVPSAAGSVPLSTCGGSVPCITGPAGTYAYSCIGGDGVQQNRGYVATTSTATSLSFTTTSAAVCSVAAIPR